MASTTLDAPRGREQEPDEDSARSIGQVRADHLTAWLRAQSQQLPRHEHSTDAARDEPWNADDTRGRPR